MTKLLPLLLLFIVTGCNFDYQRQMDINFPVLLTLHNQTTETVRIKYFYNKAEATGGFSLGPIKLKKSKTTSLKVTLSELDIIQKSLYVISGSCGNNKHWTASDENSKTAIIDTVEQQKIDITFINCH